VVKTITFDDVVVGGLPETAIPTGLFIR
jgi:hypothetical protein